MSQETCLFGEIIAETGFQSSEMQVWHLLESMQPLHSQEFPLWEGARQVPGTSFKEECLTFGRIQSLTLTMKLDGENLASLLPLLAISNLATFFKYEYMQLTLLVLLVSSQQEKLEMFSNHILVIADVSKYCLHSSVLWNHNRRATRSCYSVC